MQILLYNSKHSKTAYLIEENNPNNAYLNMFKEIDAFLEGYDNFLESKKEKEWYKEAKKGNAISARKLIEYRSNHEYEGFEILEVYTKYDD